MPNFKSAVVQSLQPAITPANHNVVAVRGEYALPGTVALNDIVELVPLPPGCVPVDVLVDADDLDSNATPTITVDVGIVNAEGTDLEASTGMITASQVARAGGIARGDQKTMSRIAASNSKRNVGVKISGAIATAQAGSIGLTLLYKAK